MKQLLRHPLRCSATRKEGGDLKGCALVGKVFENRVALEDNATINPLVRDKVTKKIKDSEENLDRKRSKTLR